MSAHARILAATLLAAITLGAGRLEAVRIGDEYLAPHPVAVILNGDGDYYALHGNTIEYYSLSSGASGPIVFESVSAYQHVAIGADRIWLSDPGNNTILSMGLPYNSASPHTIPTAQAGLAGMTIGPDGNVWFTEYSGNKIGRLSATSLTFQEWPLPHPGSGPFGITTGADGNLWFTEEAGNRIGRITPTGTITEYTIPTANSQPVGIAASTTHVAFTESNANRIGYVALADHSVFDKPIPTPVSVPWGIVRGPDAGAFYFTERNGNKIGRAHPYLPDITETPVPTPNSDPLSITLAPDGTLHFAEYAAGKIGELDITQYSGDVNGDFSVDVTDIFYLINYLFANGPAPK